MQDKEKRPEAQSPADIAREAFRRLAMRRIAPTPEAYRDIYDEIAGTRTQPAAEKVLTDLAASLAGAPEDIAHFGTRFSRAAARGDWDEYGKSLSQLVDRHLKQPAPPTPAKGAAEKPAVAQAAPAAASSTIPLVDPVAAAPARPRAFPLVDEPGARNVKAETLPLVDDTVALARRPAAPATAAASIAAGNETRQLQMLRDLLIRTLTLAVGSLLRTAPALAQESEALAASVRQADGEQALNDASARLKQLCFKIEMKSEDMAEEHELLLRLFRLLLENVSELLEDDSWLSGQIANVQDLLSGPLSHGALVDATRSLKEVIYKQGMLKHSLKEAKVTVKNMMMTFIDRLGAVAASTGDYHEKIDQYSQKISKANGIHELNGILEDVMRDTKIAQTEALRSRDEMVVARQEVQEAEARIVALETKLEQMSELVREDQLTGSLNRRGLDDAYEREASRAERRRTPLSVGLLDLDDFKRLNDTYGHTAGDEALIHLVRVIKETLRTMDVIARFGGEEFLVVLPDTPLQEAVQTVTRIQRELTKRIFMHDNKRLLITFSAGVALRAPNEDQQSLIKRADAALYKAKRAGKNRVVAAD